MAITGILCMCTCVHLYGTYVFRDCLDEFQLFTYRYSLCMVKYLSRKSQYSWADPSSWKPSAPGTPAPPWPSALSWQRCRLTKLPWRGAP